MSRGRRGSETEQQIRQEILSLELRGPQLPRVAGAWGRSSRTWRRRIPFRAATPESRRAAEKEIAELRGRLEIVAQEVIERQLTVLSDSGTVERGNALPDRIKDFKAYRDVRRARRARSGCPPRAKVSRALVPVDGVRLSEHRSALPPVQAGDHRLRSGHPRGATCRL